jgi:hypothetical protein
MAPFEAISAKRAREFGGRIDKKNRPARAKAG